MPVCSAVLPISTLANRLEGLGDRLYQPWDPRTIEFFSNEEAAASIMPACDQEAWTKEDYRVLSALFRHLPTESSAALQVMLPVLCLAFKDRVAAALTHQFPHGRTFVRRCSAFAAHTLEQLEKGETLPAFSERRKQEADKMCGYIDAGKFWAGQNTCHNIEPFRALVQRLHSIREIWRTYPECVFDAHLERAEKITIERFHEDRSAPDWALEEAELLQQRWFDAGKRGAGTVFDAAFLQDALNSPGERSSLIRFGYDCNCLGHLLFQPASSALNLLNNGTRLKTSQVKTGWLTLGILNPGVDDADPVKAFERDLDTPAYPFMTSIAQDYGITHDTEFLGAIVRHGNPAAAQHALIGFIDGQQTVQSEFGEAGLILLPTELPEPLRQSIKLLGAKKRL